MDAARIAGNRYDELEDDVLGQQVEEVIAVDEPGQALLDDREERVESAEILKEFDRAYRQLSVVPGRLAESPGGSAQEARRILSRLARWSAR